MEEDKKFKVYTFEKNCAGSLVINLESFDNTLPIRRFVFGANVKKIIVPHKYALGLFISQTALNIQKLGYFKVLKENELKTEAAALGIYVFEEGEEPVEECMNTSDIEKVLATNKIAKIRPLLKGRNSREIAFIVEYVNTHKNELYNSIVTEILETYGVKPISE